MAKFKPKIPSGTQEPPTVRLPIPLYRPLPPPPERTSNDITRSPSPIAMGGRHTLVRAGTPSQPSHRHPLSSCCNDGGWPPNPHRPTPHTGTRSHRAATMADGHQTHTDQRPALSSIFARPHPHSAKKTRRHRPANPALASSANTNAKMAPRYFFFY